MGVVGTSSALEILQESREILLQWGIMERLEYAMEYIIQHDVCKAGVPLGSACPIEAGFCLVWQSHQDGDVSQAPNQELHCSSLLQNSCSISPLVSTCS